MHAKCFINLIISESTGSSTSRTVVYKPSGCNVASSGNNNTKHFFENLAISLFAQANKVFGIIERKGKEQNDIA